MNKIINFSEHSEERLSFRSIKKEIIVNTIIFPEQKVIDKDDNKRVICQSIIKDINNKSKLLRVVIEETDYEIIVISVYLTSKINKYWEDNYEI